jgi:peptide-methionine (R)-S-oxide reductase
MFKSRARVGAAVAAEVQKPDEQWRSELTPLQYKVLRQGHTEPAFAGQYVEYHADGVYRCAGCRSELFRSGAKFESGTGWASFSEPALAAAVVLRPDRGLFLRRTKARCRQCGGHLGHVFGDGPTATGDRYCINSCVLVFEPASAADALGPKPAAPAPRTAPPAAPAAPGPPAAMKPGSAGNGPR